MLPASGILMRGVVMQVALSPSVQLAAVVSSASVSRNTHVPLHGNADLLYLDWRISHRIRLHGFAHHCLRSLHLLPDHVCPNARDDLCSYPAQHVSTLCLVTLPTQHAPLEAKAKRPSELK